MRLKDRSILCLVNVYELLLDKERFAYGTLAEDKEGSPIHPGDSEAVKWSLIGALTKYQTTILVITALLQASKLENLKSIEQKLNHTELLACLLRAITWLELWYDPAR